MTQSHAAAAGEFLHALGQALAAMSLYGASHPSRAAARERARGRLAALLSMQAPLRITFLDDDVIVDRSVLSDLRGWEWGHRLSAAGIQRLEFESVTMDETTFAQWLDQVHASVAAGGTPVTQLTVLGPIRFGPVGLSGDRTSPTPAVPVARVNDGPIEIDGRLALQDEMAAVSWVTEKVQTSGRVPVAEVEAVVRGLTLAMQSGEGALLPLVALRNADEYTTVHACNVAMLAMGLAEQQSFAPRDVRAIGVAALLHDIGKVRMPERLLTSTVALTDADRALMQTHTVEGARLLGERGAGYGLASIVAFEHHVWANGQGGYPHFVFPRTPHYVTRLVQICDVYDALCTERPYRPAWPRARTLHHMRLQAGRELDYQLLLDFFDLVGRAERRQGATVVS